MSTKWYASMTAPNTEGKTVVFALAGPFDSQAEAEPFVSRVALEAASIEGRFAHCGFGVARKEADSHPPGPLNQRLGLPVTGAGPSEDDLLIAARSKFDRKRGPKTPRGFAIVPKAAP
jgi:hypothetical protein